MTSAALLKSEQALFISLRKSYNRYKICLIYWIEENIRNAFPKNVVEKTNINKKA